MSKLEWCKNKKRGIRIVEPNENLAKSYFEKSENSIKTMNRAPSEDWKIVAAYYTCYQALYALLRKVGVKSEIHECTMEVMRFFDFSEEDINFLRDLKNKRINAQYYVTKEVGLGSTEKVKEFRLKCKKIMETSDLKAVRKDIISRLKE